MIINPKTSEENPAGPLTGAEMLRISRPGSNWRTTIAEIGVVGAFSLAATYPVDSVGEKLQILSAAQSAQMSLNVPGASNQGYDFRLMTTVESIDGTSGGVGKVDGLRVAHIFGGSSAKGGRHAVETFAVLNAPTSPDNPDRNYVGGAFTGLAQTSDNGTTSSRQGAMFGINAVGRLGPNAKNWLNLTGAEFNTQIETGGSVWYKSGIQIAGFAGDRVQGIGYDAMVSLTNMGGVAFRDGILFSDASGYAPVGAGSTLFRTQGFATIDSGIDIGSYLFTKQAIRIGQTDPSIQAGLGIRQQGNGARALIIQRTTDIDPTGNLIEVVNSVAGTVLMAVDATGYMQTAGIHNTGGPLSIGSTTGEVQYRRPLIAIGSGATAIMGKIGGPGPTNAAQYSWKQELDQDGAVYWIGVWK